MSQFPSCPVHMVLKPCVHCDKSKPAYVQTVCGDVDKGAKIETCSCGAMRQVGKSHGHVDSSRKDDDDPIHGYGPFGWHP